MKTHKPRTTYHHCEYYERNHLVDSAIFKVTSGKYIVIWRHNIDKGHSEVPKYTGEVNDMLWEAWLRNPEKSKTHKMTRREVEEFLFLDGV